MTKKFNSTSPKQAFRNSNEALEDYLADYGTMRWGGLTGRNLKSHLKAGARAAMDDFMRSPGSKGNRDFLRSALEGSGVNAEVAAELASSAKIGPERAKFHQDRNAPASTFSVR